MIIFERIEKENLKGNLIVNIYIDKVIFIRLIRKMDGTLISIYSFKQIYFLRLCFRDFFFFFIFLLLQTDVIINIKSGVTGINLVYS